MKKCDAGYSLFELLITLVILSILSSIIYPIYTDHITHTHRKQVQILLFNLANRMERYYSENNHSYLDATSEKLGIDKAATKDFYEIFVSSTATTFTLQANPVKYQAQHDTVCGSLSLNELGEKNISGNGTITNCW